MGYYKAEIEVLLNTESPEEAADALAEILNPHVNAYIKKDSELIDWQYTKPTLGLTHFEKTDGEDFELGVPSVLETSVLEKGLRLKDCFSRLEYYRNSGLEAQVSRHDLKAIYAALVTAEFQSSDQSQRLKDTIELYLKAQSFRLNRSGYAEETKAFVTKAIAISSQLLKNWVDRDEESQDRDLAVCALRTAEMLMDHATKAQNNNDRNDPNSCK